jgi:2-haloacid dehalogenase
VVERVRRHVEANLLPPGAQTRRASAQDAQADPSFDKVISVAAANSFKPHRATYTKAAEILGLKLDQILFVANHAFDVIGAKSAGMRSAMINRRDRPFEQTPYKPDITVPTMKDLADAIV